MFKNILLIIAFLIPCGCAQNHCNDSYQVSEKIEQNHILVKTINSCNKKVIYLQEVIRLANDSVINDGLYKEFYPSGAVKATAYFKNNLPDSIWIKYREDGNMIFKNYYMDGQLKGFQNTYYANGRINNRNYHKSNDEIIFKIHYTNSGKIESISGQSFRVDLNKDINQYKLGDELIVTNEVVMIDDIRTSLHVNMRLMNTVLIDTVVTDFLSIKNKYVSGLFYNLRSKGKYNFVINSVLTDKKSNQIIKEDTISFNVIVN